MELMDQIAETPETKEVVVEAIPTASSTANSPGCSSIAAFWKKR